MELNEYQKKALETAVYPEESRIIYPTIGLAGETGEVCDKVKKVIRDNNGDFTPAKKEEIIKELGDVLWYVATLSNDMGFSLQTVAEMNYAKLSSRKERGVIGGEGDNR